MRRLVFSLVLLTFAVCVVAAKPAAKIYGAVSSKEAFSGDRLFAVLDSVGGTGTWMEWDVNGEKDPSVMLALDPLLKQKD